MDDYGIGAASLAGLSVYSDACRQSGRTTRMAASLKGGEVVVCATNDEARHLNNHLREKHSNLPAVTIVSAKSISDMLSNPPSTASRPTFVFTEQFIERAYRQAIHRCADDFKELGTERWQRDLGHDRPPPARYNMESR